jgi:hypothetical protein
MSDYAPNGSLSHLPDRSELSIPALRANHPMRKMPERSKGSAIGYVICPTTNTIIKSESDTEHKAIQYLYADPAVRRVQEQFAAIEYPDDQGEFHTHYLDLRAVTHAGSNFGFLVKPSSTAARTRLSDFAKMLSDWTPSSVADQLDVITERDMPEWQVRNSQHFLDVRRDHRTYTDELVAAAAPDLLDPIAIKDFAVQFGGGEFAFRPILRAIFFGTFVCVTPGLIDADSQIQFSGAVTPDLDEVARR